MLDNTGRAIELVDVNPFAKRIVHISNRLELPKPGKVIAGGLDEVIADPPPGYQVVRIGWSGNTVSDSTRHLADTVQKKIIDGVTYITFHLRERDKAHYYDITNNGVIWAANHYEAEKAKQAFEAEYTDKSTGETYAIWKAIEGFRRVNKEISEITIDHLRPNDSIVVHDSHLIPLGAQLKRRTQEAKMANVSFAYFHHTPMMDKHMLQLFSQREQDFFKNLLHDLYAYDLVGLQTQEDAQALHSIIGEVDYQNPGFFESQPFRQTANEDGTHTRFGAFPVASNFAKYEALAKQGANSPEVLKFMAGLPNGTVDTMSVDRLDYMKGLVEKARGWGRYLREFGQPGLHQHLLQFAPFGRGDTPAFQEYRRSTNREFTTLTQTFGDHSLLREEKVPHVFHLGLATYSNDALIASLRDGMNVYGGEYLAAQIGRDKPGVLLMSKFAGFARIYRGALLSFDPHDSLSMARALHRSDQMGKGERQELLGRALKIQESFNNDRWQISLIEQSRHAAQPRLALAA